jgi:hypothetical protein
MHVSVLVLCPGTPSSLVRLCCCIALINQRGYPPCTHISYRSCGVALGRPAKEGKLSLHGCLSVSLCVCAAVWERHRHRYEVNPALVGDLEAAGLYFTGVCVCVCACVCVCVRERESAGVDVCRHVHGGELGVEGGVGAEGSCYHTRTTRTEGHMTAAPDNVFSHQTALLNPCPTPACAPTGRDEGGERMEVAELPTSVHPFYLGVQVRLVM